MLTFWLNNINKWIKYRNVKNSNNIISEEIKEEQLLNDKIQYSEEKEENNEKKEIIPSSNDADFINFSKINKII